MAVVGQGHFAQAAVLPGASQVDEVELVALVSGSTRKLEQLGDRYRVPHRCTYDEYDDLLESGEVDAVYVAVPNDRHAEFTIRAAAAGVHVLCEKPMATDERECLEMIRACEDADVKLMVAYRLHFEASNLEAIKTVAEGRIGRPRLFNSTFTFQVREGNVRTQPRPGAGPLWDIGIYCVNAARYLFREEPIEVSAMRQESPDDPRFEHVPEGIAATMRFPSGALATFVCSFGAADRAHYEVIGSEGIVDVDNAYEYTEDMFVRFTDDGGTRTRRFRKRDQIAAEIEYFARCVMEDREPEPSGREGLADVRVLTAIEQAAAAREHVRIAPLPRARRPQREQEIRKPPHREPPLVDVASATR